MIIIRFLKPLIFVFLISTTIINAEILYDLLQMNTYCRCTENGSNVANNKLETKCSQLYSRGWRTLGSLGIVCAWYPKLESKEVANEGPGISDLKNVCESGNKIQNEYYLECKEGKSSPFPYRRG